MGCKEHVQNYYAKTYWHIFSLHSLYPLLLKLCGFHILKLYEPIWENGHKYGPWWIGQVHTVQKYGSITWLFECRFESHDVQQSRDLVIALQIDSLK